MPGEGQECKNQHFLLHAHWLVEDLGSELEFSDKGRGYGVRVARVLGCTCGVAERESCADIWGKDIQAEGTICAKALRQIGAWCVRGTARRPVWLEPVSEGEREKGRAW